MSEHKFTPGPWWSDTSHYGTIYIEANAVIDKRLQQEVCAVGPTESGRGQQEANARLIAAAPDLLEALGALGIIGNGYCFCSEDRDPSKGDHQPECIDARLAISKATGEAP